ncbi:protein of unknown function [Rhizobium sp. RU20A]|uniref:caspase family protein n=1 Tax=Rhizobium sp. RU20A TaxID=1907412 RepID=UPI0009570598|nr:caspase family protein [Rhizobium sp. RU20A]SIQ00410.1 protein of unknown function [Rhizobium sp. RU20A]
MTGSSRRRLRARLCGLLASTGLLATTALAAGPATAADRALLIGIGTYQNLPPELFLHGPKNDVVAMQGLLTKTLGFAPETIKVLKDGEATRDTVTGQIQQWLIDGTKPGDRVYLYFSGHGLQVKDLSGDEEDGMDEALAPFDIKPGDTDFTNTILDDELEPLLAKLKDRQVTVVIDACHSGTISRSLSVDVANGIEGARYLPRPFAKPVDQKLTRGIRIDTGVIDKPAKLTEAGITTWSAAAPYQVAWDDTRLPEDKRHGVFTTAYIAGSEPGKADANSNGLISNAELFEYVKAESAAYCKTQKNCQNLDPQLETQAGALGVSVAKPEAKPQTVVTPVKIENNKVEVPADPAYTATPGQTTTPAVTNIAAAAPAYVDANPLAAVTDIVGKPDTGEVVVKLDRTGPMKKGDVFHISVTSKKAGNLILLDVNGKGEATQIFPNEFAQKITPLTPDSTLTIPDDYYGFDFEADGKGDSVLVALVVSDPVDLKDVAPATRGLKAASAARETVSSIVTRLQKTWTGDLDTRGIQWQMGTLTYTIE